MKYLKILELTAIDDIIVSCLIIIVASFAERIILRRIVKILTVKLISDLGINIRFRIYKLLKISTKYLFIWISLIIGAAAWGGISLQGTVIILGFANFVFFSFILRLLSYFTQKKATLSIGSVIIFILFVKSIDRSGIISRFLDNVIINIMIAKFSISQLLSAMLYVILVYSSIKVFNQILTYAMNKTNIDESERTVYIKIIQYISLAFGTLILLNKIGVSQSNLTFLTGAIGVGFGLGIQKTVSNLINGIIIMTEEKIKINDVIFLPNGESGYVRSIDTRSTIIENFSGEKVIIPNEYIYNEVIKSINFGSRKCKFTINFTVNHDTDLENVIKIAKHTAENNEYVSKKDQPSCRVDDITQNGFNIGLRVWVDDWNNEDRDMWNLKSDIVIALQKELKKHDISFALNKIKVSH